METTVFLGVRNPTTKEKKEHNCDLVFIREDQKGDEVLIWVNRPFGDYGWSQWGQSTEILGANVSDIEEYFNQSNY